MSHFASESFWDSYNKLPDQVRELADQKFELLKANSKHHPFILKRLVVIDQFELGKDTEHLASRLTKGFFGSGLVHTQSTIS